MSRFAKIFLSSLALIIVIAFVWLSTLDLNKYKSMVQGKVKDNAGLEITIGDIDFSPWKLDELSVSDISVKLPDEYQILKLNHVAVDVGLMSLLSETIVIDYVHIDGLEVDVNNNLNEHFAQRPKSEPEQETTTKQDPTKIQLDYLLLTSPKISYQDPSNHFVSMPLTLVVSDLLIDPSSDMPLSRIQAQVDSQLMSFNNIELPDSKLILSKSNDNQLSQAFTCDCFDGNWQINSSTEMPVMGQLDATSVEVKIKEGQIDVAAILKKLGIETTAPKEESDKLDEKDNAKEAEKVDLAAITLPVKTASLKLDIQNLTVKNGAETLNDINISLKDFPLVENHKLSVGQDVWKEFETDDDELNVSIANVVSGNHTVSDIKVTGNIQQGKLALAPVSFSIWDIPLSFNTGVTLNDKNLPVSFSTDLVDLQLSKIMTNLELDPLKGKGGVNLSSSLTSQLLADKSPLDLLDGDLALTGEALAIENFDLDGLVSGFKESQEASLVNVGSFLAAGPIGMIASQFTQAGAGAMNSGKGTTNLSKVVTKADIKQGVLNFTDAAIATGKHRLAVQGGIDLNSQEFKDLKFAVLDDKGCASLEQTIKGSISSPDTKIAKSALKTLVAPLGDLLNKGQKLLGKKCKPFYQGDVAHPQN